MDLLFQSKKAWLIPFAILSCISIVIYVLWCDIDWMKTICLMMSTMLVGMTIFFVFMIVFKWTTWVRRILAILYISFIIYYFVDGYISRWYVIIPSFLFMFLFMMWNLGGVKNCIIASPYKEKISNMCECINAEFEDYSEGVDKYNSRNNFGFFNQVHKKRKVNITKYSFNSSGLDMFAFIDALCGVSTNGWETKVEKLNKKLGGISEKKNALYADEAISDEYERISDIRRRNRELGVHNVKEDEILVEISDIKKKGIKKQKKILKKRI